MAGISYYYTMYCKGEQQHIDEFKRRIQDAFEKGAITAASYRMDDSPTSFFVNVEQTRGEPYKDYVAIMKEFTGKTGSPLSFFLAIGEYDNPGVSRRQCGYYTLKDGNVDTYEEFFFEPDDGDDLSETLERLEKLYKDKVVPALEDWRKDVSPAGAGERLIYSSFTLYRLGSPEQFDAFRGYLKEKIDSGDYSPSECNLDYSPSAMTFSDQRSVGEFYDELKEIFNDFAENVIEDDDLSVFFLLDEQTTSFDNTHTCGYIELLNDEEDFFVFEPEGGAGFSVEQWLAFKEENYKDYILPYLLECRVNNGDSIDEWKNEPEVLSNFILTNPFVIGDLSEELKHSFVDAFTVADWLTVVHNDPTALKNVPESIKTEWFCLAGLWKNPGFIEYVPEAFWRNRPFCLDAVKISGRAIDFVPDEFKTNQLPAYAELSALNEQLERDPENPHLLNKRGILFVTQFDGYPFADLLGYSDFAKAAALAPDNDGVLKNFARIKKLMQEDKTYRGKTIYDNVDEAMDAVKKEGNELRFVVRDCRTPEVCRAALENNGYTIKYVPGEIITPELCLAAVTEEGAALDFVPMPFRSPELCRIAVQKNGFALKSVHVTLRTLELCLAAVKRNGRALQYVPEALQEQVEKEAGIA
jgi:hypothetical protein